jgi:hypothetical protein
LKMAPEVMIGYNFPSSIYISGPVTRILVRK